MKRVVFFSVFLMFVATGTRAQLVRDLYKIYNPVYSSSVYLDTCDIYSPFGAIAPGTHYGLEVGTGFSSFSGGPGAIGSYISPSVSYASGQNFQVVGGVTFARFNFPGGVPGSDISGGIPATSTPYRVWAYSHYRFTNRFSVYAVGEFSRNQPYYSFFTNRYSRFNSGRFGVGFTYRISEKTTIGASFNFQNRENPLSGIYSSPFGFPY